VLKGLSLAAHDTYRRDLAEWVAATLTDGVLAPSEQVQEKAGGIVVLLRRAVGKLDRAALTATERRILEILALGRSSKEIAAMLGRSTKTVDNHVSAILKKLQAQGRGEAVARARRSGLLDDERALFNL
ncbi:MAG: LuxR C-terminal-related transcriptional regulator, partial [Vulcanimicrobiaceae bacterium]